MEKIKHLLTVLDKEQALHDYITTLFCYTIYRANPEQEELVSIFKESISEETGVEIVTLIQRWLETAKQQGLVEGKQQGLAEGKQQSLAEMALKLADRGYNVAEIAAVTSLGIEDINALIKENIH